jgi:hypothetical protein
MNRYDEHTFRAKIDAALRQVRTILDNTRNPQSPADVPHRYEDKYLLAEFVGSVAIASLLQCLELVGLSEEGLARLREWAKTRSITLRLNAREDCRFLREESRHVESPEHVIESRGLLGKSTRTEKIVVKITEYFWSFDFHYELVAYQGNAPENAVALLVRRGSVELVTAVNQTPRPTTVVKPPVDADITWLFEHLDQEGRPVLGIDRTAKDCHTPRRNRQVYEALVSLERLHVWCSRVVGYFTSELFPVYPDHGRDLSAITDAGVFVPVVPLFENGVRVEGEGLLPESYRKALVEEERRSLAEKCRALATAFPSDSSLITAVEAGLLVALLHAKQVIEHFSDAVDHVENMLRSQLVAAIGKEVTPVDFGAYMDFHHRKLVKEAYRPRPFSYAVRRPDHDPEGVLAIEAEHGSAMAEPISTTVAVSQAARPMTFALDAATRVSFRGERYLHGWIGHRFSLQTGLSASLVARARQFSSFIVLVGRISAVDVFEPKHGIVVHNKDVLKIPLMLEEIPTPKQFRDAIESLSPEQQRFAKAFRGMQLESTLFGVCVIQIKPQLEKLLKLPPDSLTKEIKLTQELLGLFSEFQIPSDLLSYDGDPEEPTAMKLARVTEYTRRMQEMIDLSKKRELEAEREREAMRLAEANRTIMEMDGPSSAYPTPLPGALQSPARRYSAGHVPPMPRAAAPGFGPPPVPSAPSAAAAPRPAPAMAAPTPKVARSAPAGTANASPPAPQNKPSTPTQSAVTRETATAADPSDYTSIPAALDKKFGELDEDSALHATLIHTGDTWTRSAQKSLLTAAVTSQLGKDEQKDEKSKAFDLLDALTKSGALELEEAALHVVIASTHSFDRTLLETVIQDNVNPIEKVERSLMIVGSTIFGLPVSEIVAEDQAERFFGASPNLRTLEGGPKLSNDG